MFEVTTDEICFGADFLEVFVIVMDAAVNAMGIIMARQEIGFNAFGACAFLAVFAFAVATKHCGIILCADGAAFLFRSCGCSRCSGCLGYFKSHIRI
jgi:hypothetical protein